MEMWKSTERIPTFPHALSKKIDLDVERPLHRSE
jgi:hypothetical protein